MSWSTKIESIEQLVEILETDKNCSVHKHKGNYKNVNIYYHESFIKFREKYKFSENIFCEIIERYENNSSYDEDNVNFFDIEIYENEESYDRIKIYFDENTHNEIMFLLLNNYMQKDHSS